jgi:DNA (cytosine-5)-methyltransferase 1
MKVLSLFSGIGGFDTAAEQVGFEVIGQVEINPFCNAVLKKHWPNVKRLEDIKNVNGTEFGPVDLICGGPPCQPASTAGKRKGKADDRWLWPETIRLVKTIRPRWIIFENPTGLLSLQGGISFDEVLSELEDARYYNYRENGENKIAPIIIPAASVNAPHRRDRIWIVAYAPLNDARRATGELCEAERGSRGTLHRESCGADRHAADAGRANVPGWHDTQERQQYGGRGESWGEPASSNWQQPWLEVATRLCRVDDGLPAGVDGLELSKSKHREERLKALGNAIVPQVVMEIMRAIKAVDE